MMRRIALVLVVFAVAIQPTPTFARDQPADGKRKIITQVQPIYPQMARTMRICGTIKMEASVGRDGRPKLVDVKGGHPTLIKAGVDAVSNWRWAPGPNETKESIEMTFTPDSQ